MENLKLPPGFRFHPTDEELILQYLRRKVFSFPLPASIIPEINIGTYNPWDFHDGSVQEKYFFSVREAKYSNGSRINRATASGYWKATGKEKAVLALKYNNQVVGAKRTLVFYRGKAPSGSKTDWVMHEYRLAMPRVKDMTNIDSPPKRDWVLCRVFKKRRATSMNIGHQEEESRANGFIDFMGCNSLPPSSSSSSCVTDESSNGDDSPSYP